MSQRSSLRRMLVVVVLGGAAPAIAAPTENPPAVELRAGLGAAGWAAGDANGPALSALADVGYRATSWLRAGVHGTLLIAHNSITDATDLLGAIGPMATVVLRDRVRLGAGVGVGGGLTAEHPDGALVLLAAAGVTLHRGARTAVDLEADVFAGAGTAEETSDEPLGVALDLVMSW